MGGKNRKGCILIAVIKKCRVFLESHLARGGDAASLPPPATACDLLCLDPSLFLRFLKAYRRKTENHPTKKKNEINKNTRIVHMATDLANFKRVKSLPAQIEVTEEKKRGFQSLFCQSLSFSEREETVCGGLGRNKHSKSNCSLIMFLPRTQFDPTTSVQHFGC